MQEKVNWDKLMNDVYNYIFQVDSKEFKSYKKNNFHGTYLVHWKNGKITKEVV